MCVVDGGVSNSPLLNNPSLSAMGGFFPNGVAATIILLQPEQQGSIQVPPGTATLFEIFCWLKRQAPSQLLVYVWVQSGAVPARYFCNTVANIQKCTTRSWDVVLVHFILKIPSSYFSDLFCIIKS